MSKNLLTTIKRLLVVAVVIAAAWGGSWAYTDYSHNKAVTVVNSQHQVTQISYHGENGVDALTLLKKRANVQTKHYSFGDQVVSVNGSVGNGPKYWTFYVNGKEASEGAGSYKTKDSDILEWKLQ